MTTDTEYRVCVRGEHARDDGLCIDMGELFEGVAWWDVPLPGCPDCGGDVVWFEAGYVPGTRKCVGLPVRLTADERPQYDIDNGCGSMFSVQVDGGRVHLRRERFF